MSAPTWIPFIIIIVASTLLSTILTGVTRFVSRRVGFVANPKQDRWNANAVPLGGGFAIAISTLSLSNFFGAETSRTLMPAILAIAALGVIDDTIGASPKLKLLVQIGAATFVAVSGFQFSFGSSFASLAFSIFWIVGFSNSMNLLDNMDGISSGVATIVCLGLALLFSQNAATQNLIPIALVTAGASFGFLLHNFNPAKIFMGDTGSLTLGFMVGTLSTRIPAPGVGGNWTWISLALACLLLAAPILDTSLVMICRKIGNRPLTQGGRDHCTHRLVRVGFSERQTAAIIYLISFFGLANAYAALTLPILTIAITLPPVILAFALYLLLLLKVPASDFEKVNISINRQENSQ